MEGRDIMLSTRESGEWFDQNFAGSPVMVILRGYSPDRTVELARLAWASGIKLVEVPVQGSESLAALEAVCLASPGEHAPVGAGTIIAADQIAVVRGAGARFTVAPGLDLDVSAASEAAGMPHLPGVATAGEVQRAWAHGLRWQKLFPAANLGAGLIGALHGPFPRVRFVATGGITTGNAPDFLAGGASAVSLGASFADVTPSELISLVNSSAVH